MTTYRRLAPLPLLLIGLAVIATLALIPWVVQAQSQEVTATAAATGANPPAKPTNLSASAEHDQVTLTWTASTDQTVTHYAILRRNPDTDASQVFHVIESNAGPETGYTDNSVSAEGSYIYRAKAVSPTGVSQWSGYVKAETPAAPDSTLEPTPTPTPTPSPEPVSTPTPEDLRPTGLTVSLVESKVTLSWTAPKEDAESVDGYEILRRRPMEGEGALATLVADTESTATTYTDATANEPGVRYVYRVKALRGDDVSLWSNFDKIELPSDYVPDPIPTPEPESTSDDQAPTGLSAALANGGGVDLSWSAPSEDADSVTGYEVLRAVGEGEMTTLAADTASTTTAYTDATATEAGETYAYQVKAIRGEDRSQASGQAQVQIPHDPVDLAPTGLTAVVLTASVVVVGEDSTTTYSTSVRLSWSAPAEDADSVTGYEILRAVGDGEIATLKADTGSTSTFYTDATATQSGTSYTYKVKAVRGEDRSQTSGQARVQIPHNPVDLAPSDLTAEAVDGGVALSWDAPVEDAESVTGYEIERTVGVGSNQREFTTLVADTASADTAYTDATATAAYETYTYRVTARRGEDRSEPSGEASVFLAVVTVGDIVTPVPTPGPEYAYAVMVDLDSESNGFLQVAAGWYHMCALRKDGTVSCWGKFGHRGIYANPNPPKSPDGIYDQIVAGKDSSCGVRSDGKAICWDDAKKMGRINNDKPKKWIHTFTQSGVCWLNVDGTLGCSGDHHGAPDGQFKSVTTGWNFGCALNLDDEAVCWNFGNDLTPPTGEFRFLQAGGSRVCGIRKDTDHTLVCWEWEGRASRGGQYYTNSYHLDENDPPDGKFNFVYVHYTQTCGVTVDGDIKCWMGAGNNETPLVKNMNLLTPTGDFEEVSMNWYLHACGLKTDTSIACWKYDGTVMDTPSLETPWHDNADLLSLSLSGSEIEFDRDTLTYTASADNEVATTTVAAGATNRFADVSISPSDDDSATDGHQVNLTVGSNTITITVAAADGVTTKTYTVTVTRAS